jgi:hypothetical protein
MLSISAAMAPGSPGLLRAPPPQGAPLNPATAAAQAVAAAAAAQHASLGPRAMGAAAASNSLSGWNTSETADVFGGSLLPSEVPRPGLGLAESHIPSNMRMNLEYDRRRHEAEHAINHADLTHGRAPSNYFSGEGFSRSMPAKELQTHMLEPGQGPPSASAAINIPRHANGMPVPVPGSRGHGPSAFLQAGRASSGGIAESMSKPESPAASPRLSDVPGPPASGSTGASRASSPGVAAALASKEMREYWSVTTLGELLSKLGLHNYTEVFTSQEVDLSTFLTLTETDMRELGVTTFGARRKMLMGTCCQS